ncbi:MAG: primosomal protein N' [Bacteroidales bacterium]|nr:primosomal protein N' [Bacteroidales bacterium]
MEERELYIEALLPLALPRTLTYLVPEECGEVEVGQRVLVPLGRHKFYSAVVRRVGVPKPEGYAVKAVLQVLDGPAVVGQRQLDFWEWMASYYLSTEGEVMDAALPSGFKLESETKLAIHPEYTGEVSDLSDKEIRLVSLLSEEGSLSLQEIEKRFSVARVMGWVQCLLERKIIALYEEVEEKYRPRTETCLSLAEPYASEESTLAEVFAVLEKNSRLQKQADTLLVFLDLLHKSGQHLLAKRQLLQSEKANESSLRQLLKKGVLLQQEVAVSRLAESVSEVSPDSIRLTEAQQEAKDSIHRQFENFPVVLLHGVTGSGKTEIYIKMIQETLSQGKQVLYLLPEIALTTQIINRLRKYFGGKAGVYHSRFNEQERVEIWKRVQAEGENGYQVILGARSALFLPFRDLGLVIVDEEHDASFKQYDPAPRYHARDAAIVLAQKCRAKVLLGSATPSVESYYNVKRGKYGLVRLAQRYAGVELPQVKVLDLKRSQCTPKGYVPFSKELMDRISQAMENREQVILFQNRRGFSPHLECGVCHYIPVCRHCDVSLTYHKDRHQLRCHYCGYTEDIPHECTRCHSPQLQMRGFGTEKVEEELAAYFPEARIVRLDYDTTRSRTAYQRIISDFEQRKIDILVGTQMVTKGLDFDGVSTVGILNADNMLYYPDFRANERAYQVLAQVGGRAGRKHKRGEVLIQSYTTDHPIFQWVVRSDYETMFRQELVTRQRFLYPPFCRFVKVSLKCKQTLALDMAASALAHLLRQRFGDKVLGPAYPAIPRIKNYYSKDIILKITAVKQLAEIKAWLRQAADTILAEKAYRSVSVFFDVDPY